ncbi:MAG: putative Universal stress protein [Verrucomicrobiales bacterium]|nr:putative Universal stress protein [Verrucomicrobiales bacterium]
MPVDFSSASLRALDYATERAGETGAAIILLHVLQPLVGPSRYETAELQSLKVEVRRDVKRRLEKLAQERTTAEVPIKAWLLEGVAGEKILEAAKRTGSDSIIMGSAGRKGIRRLFLGSVAEAIVRTADVPVTIVREPQKHQQRARGMKRRMTGTVRRARIGPKEGTRATGSGR